jgi:hypothetical protein
MLLSSFLGMLLSGFRLLVLHYRILIRFALDLFLNLFFDFAHHFRFNILCIAGLFVGLFLTIAVARLELFHNAPWTFIVLLFIILVLGILVQR